jgi:hypothetical protein
MNDPVYRKANIKRKSGNFAHAARFRKQPHTSAAGLLDRGRKAMR